MNRGDEDLLRARHLGWIAVLVLVVATATTGVAAATGLIFAPPRPYASAPAGAPWTFFSTNPYGPRDSGPVLLHQRPAALARLNRKAEAVLARHGVTARCGGDAAHPRACVLPGGEPVPPSALVPVLGLSEGPADYSVKPLSAAEAHAWLCAHPEQRPDTDLGERPAPTAGYGDC